MSERVAKVDISEDLDGIVVKITDPDGNSATARADLNEAARAPPDTTEWVATVINEAIAKVVRMRIERGLPVGGK